MRKALLLLLLGRLRHPMEPCCNAGRGAGWINESQQHLLAQAGGGLGRQHVYTMTQRGQQLCTWRINLPVPVAAAWTSQAPIWSYQ